MRRKVKLKAFEVDEILRRRNYDKLKNFHF